MTTSGMHRRPFEGRHLVFFFFFFFLFANCFAKILLVSNEKETNYQFGVAVMALHFQN